MTKSEIETVANRVLAHHLGRSGFEGAEIRFARDHQDDESILVIAKFDKEARSIASGPLFDIVGDLRQQLLDLGEERFPYIDYDLDGGSATRRA